MSRLDEQGADALLQIREPVNRFPDFVRFAVQRLKTLCPTRGKVKIADANVTPEHLICDKGSIFW